MKEEKIVSPLRNERVIVRYINKETSITDKRHVLYGGMAEKAQVILTVPVVRTSGTYKNVFTKAEKEYFESVLGINLSVLTKVDNYWDNYAVALGKEDTILDLSTIDDYIKYKVLLANDKLICPSLKDLNERHLATYRYVIITSEGELTMASDKRKTKVECYKLAGKIESDFDTLKAVVEQIEKRPISETTTTEFLANRLDELIETNYREVYNILTDEHLGTMVLIKKGVSRGLVSKAGDFYYLKADNNNKTPMCEDGQDPTIKNAVNFLNNPKNQDIKFGLEAQIEAIDSKK